MGEWDGFLADGYDVEESSASFSYSETDAVAVEEYTETAFAVETEVDVHEVHAAEVVETVEAVELVEVSDVTFETYLSVTETDTVAGAYESDASYGHSAEGGPGSDDDNGLSHDGDAAHDGDPAQGGETADDTGATYEDLI
ncbi:hypothetical protein ACIRST_22835 [Kitasatospora sp. NPDC101447]|uniref:hypothetical protein n=1 Tax=Kitasatospora sp. NPDC101447 TaxID=3364102 RepID=UPI003821EC81